MTIKQNLENKEQKIALVVAGVFIAALLGKIDCTYCFSTTEKPIEQTDSQLIETNNNKQEVVQEEEDKKEKNAHISAFGITLKKTTKAEIRRKFSIIETRPVNGFPEYEVVWLDTKDFSLGDIGVVEVLVFVNPQERVEQITLIFSGKVFRKLRQILSKKYQLKFKEEPFVGNCRAKYETKNDVICLEQPHMGGFRTYLIYRTKEIDDLAEAHDQKEKDQKQQEIENQL